MCICGDQVKGLCNFRVDSLWVSLWLLRNKLPFRAKFIHPLNDLHPIIYPLNTLYFNGSHNALQRNWQKIAWFTDILCFLILCVGSTIFNVNCWNGFFMPSVLTHKHNYNHRRKSSNSYVYCGYRNGRELFRVDDNWFFSGTYNYTAQKITQIA